MAFWGMSNQFDIITEELVVYKGTVFKEFDDFVEEVKSDFSSLWQEVEAGVPLLVVGFSSAYLEDNGIPTPSNVNRWDSDWFGVGRCLGHALAITQGIAEIIEGGGLIAGGAGGGLVLALPSGGTAVIAGGVVVTVGAVEVTHGSLVIGNALGNFNQDIYFSKRSSSGGGGSGKFYRSKSERKKALKRDAEDPNSGLSDEARDFIRKTKGDKVPEGYEVSHEKPLYTEKTPKEKRKIDKEWNLKTQEKSTHRGRHKVCGDQYHEYPR